MRPLFSITLLSIISRAGRGGRTVEKGEKALAFPRHQFPICLVPPCLLTDRSASKISRLLFSLPFFSPFFFSFSFLSFTSNLKYWQRSLIIIRPPMSFWEVAKPILIEVGIALIPLGLSALGQCLSSKAENAGDLDSTLHKKWREGNA